MERLIDQAMVYPGPASRRMLDELARYVISEPWPFAIDLENSRGMWLRTVDGQDLFDWTGFYGSKLLGHNHPALQDPDYLRRLALAAANKVANPDFLTPQCLAYYRLIHSLAPLCMRNPRLEVYAVNSGAEAVENLMKYLINLHDQKLARTGQAIGQRRFIYFDQAFHGRTIFALNVTQMSHAPVITRDYHGLVAGNLQVPFPAANADEPEQAKQQRVDRSLEIVEDCLRRYSHEVVGIVVEPIQGAGGHRIAPARFFRMLSELAHRYEVTLGFDEVQTAGGQTGSIFAIDQFDLPHPPHAVATAKKFGCGVVYMLHPMDDQGVLDSTWGGALADMVRVVEEFGVVERERLVEQVPAKARRLVEGLRAVAAARPGFVSNIRGMGLYQGFSLPRAEDRRRFITDALEKQSLLLLGAATTTIRLRPPLSVTEAEIDLLVEKIARLVAAM